MSDYMLTLSTGRDGPPFEFTDFGTELTEKKGASKKTLSSKINRKLPITLRRHCNFARSRSHLSSIAPVYLPSVFILLSYFNLRLKVRRTTYDKIKPSGHRAYKFCNLFSWALH